MRSLSVRRRAVGRGDAGAGHGMAAHGLGDEAAGLHVFDERRRFAMAELRRGLRSEYRARFEALRQEDGGGAG